MRTLSHSARDAAIAMAALVLPLAIAFPTGAATWDGSEENRDGVLHMLNPAAPAETPPLIVLPGDEN